MTEAEARTNILAYVVDLIGGLDRKYADLLHAEHMVPDFLEEYVMGPETWQRTWQSTVYQAAMRYFFHTQRLATPTVLGTLLPGLGVPVESLSAYMRSLDAARAEFPLSEANLRLYIDTLRTYRSFYEWQHLVISANEVMKSDPRQGALMVHEGLSKIAEAVSPSEKVWNFREMAGLRAERHARFMALAHQGIAGHYTGLLPYDDKTRGMLPGEIAVIVGRTSQGKTVVLQHVAVKALR